MMKKEYLSPEINIIDIAFEDIITASSAKLEVLRDLGSDEPLSVDTPIQNLN